MTKMKKRSEVVLIIDGFIDEPSSLGVPPYISPHVRVTAGAALDAGASVTYITIDDLRRGVRTTPAHVSVFLGGASVPGRYLRAMPASAEEIRRFSEGLFGFRILGGPATYDDNYEQLGSFDFIAKKDPASCVYDFLTRGEASNRWRSKEEWNRWLLKGATIVTKHPDFPQPLIADIESYRGCLRYKSGGCSFCVEPLKGAPLFREPEEIIEEVRALHALGVRNFRIGGQTCFISYKARIKGNSITLNETAVRKLLSGIARLNVDVLHLDNANPAVIADHPDDARKILKTIVEYCTSGNILALGMESADPVVIERNNLNANPEQVFEAIKLINEIGGERGETGLPKLLPGLNFIIGLEGESKKTLRDNLAFLNRVQKSGLLIRRINIRQVMPIRRSFRMGIKHSDFLRFKETVRKEIDRPMLERLVPKGTVLKRVFLELNEGNKTFGRQIGTYPLLVGFEYPLETGKFVDAVVIGWGFRSITAVEFPFPINSASLTAIQSLPLVGERRALRIWRKRPIRDTDDLAKAIDDPLVAMQLTKIVSFDV
ncbi:MAG: radical SAM protein [Methanomassiliicoccales archaeon]